MFYRAPSRGGRGRRAAVNLVVCFGWGGRFRFFLSIFFFFERTRPAASMRPPFFIYTSTSSGVRTGCHSLICLSVCVCVCVTLVLFTDCESCTRPISTNPASLESSEYGLTCGTCFVACRLEVVAVRGLLWLSWCSGWGGFFRVFFFDFLFSSNAHGLLQL